MQVVSDFNRLFAMELLEYSTIMYVWWRKYWVDNYDEGNNCTGIRHNDNWL